MRHWDKFCLLMWKNFKIQTRKPISLCFEIGIPLVMTAFIFFLRYEVDLRIENGSGPEISNPCDSYKAMQPDVYERVYSPSTSGLLNKIMQPYPFIKPEKNAEELEEYLASINFTESSLWSSVGMQFDDNLGDSPASNYTVNLRYRLIYKGNWHTEELYPSFKISYGLGDEGSVYETDGFLWVMCQLTNDIRFSTTGRNISVRIAQFPQPPYLYDSFIVSMGTSLLFGTFFMTAFIYAFISIIKSITLEKERQLKESMKIMGLPTWLHWTAWFFEFIPIYTIVIIIITISMQIDIGNGKVLAYTNWSIILVFLLVYVSGIITLAFAVSSFFSKASKAASLAGIIMTIGLIPYLIVRCGDYINISPFTKYMSSLSVVSGMCYAFDLILIAESNYKGIQWSNMFDTTIDIQISFGGVLLVMIFDIFLYLCIALYVEQIFPGDFGVPQKWYFLFTSEFWKGGSSTEDNTTPRSNMSEFFENEPTNLKAGIRIQNLTKKFGPNEVVRGISLNLYEDQITVLLGHNGAGKTTTMSMLTGMFPPTSGNALVNGYGIRKQIMKVRDSMGYCPQHNVLFDDLTVREHLQFFSRLKGCQGDEVDVDADNFLRLLSLEDKAHAKSSALSGGMKRKLCVGIALCGKSKVILLDEPTAGMDPSARRFIWEFLQKEKKGRTILLTTHYMDEADLLGDRIAIMSAGELKCCGSSFFLKKKYGTGYHLIIEELPNCDDRIITGLLRSYIPGVEVQSKAGTELMYLLPEENVSQFPEMLSELENRSDSLGIRSFGISLTDLEEVFMKVGTNDTGKMLYDKSDPGEVNVPIESQKPVFETGMTLKINQVKAVFLKKVLSTIRSLKMEIVKTLLPILYLVLIDLSASTYSTQTNSSRNFTLEAYDSPITLVEKSASGAHKQYTDMLDRMNQKYELTDNITKASIDLIQNSRSLFRYKYVIGASFDDHLGPIAWYNDHIYHSSPLSLQLMMNMLLKDEFQMNFVNYPIPHQRTSEETQYMEMALSSGYMIGLSLVVAYVANFYILFPIRERACKAKHLQFVSGMNVVIFWSIAYIIDLITMLVPLSAILITMAIIQPVGLATFYHLSLLALLLFSFGVAVIPFMYLFSYLFDVPSTGYSRAFALGFAAGYPMMGVLLILQSNDIDSSVLTWILRIVPHFNFSDALTKVMYYQDCNEIQGNCESLGVATPLIMTYLIALISFILIILIDLKIFSNLLYKISSHEIPSEQPHLIDDDVISENQTVNNTPLKNLETNHVLILKNLTKNYKNFTAVKSLNLLVKRSECFGLLGVNGAGKTTTFKMMTGDERITSGDGWVNGLSIRDKMEEVHKFIGYCPQFDAMLNDLTARETLKMFSLIRGVPSDECNFTVLTLAKQFDFTEHLDKKISELSGGNRRKVSTAISLIGDAPVIFLDEPTTGMDPATKRHLWNALKKIRESKKSLVLTSHSMEECEALCTRLAIMVNGCFQCLGSIQHLKNKFAEGFSVTLKLRKAEHSSGLEHSDTSKVEQYMSQHFTRCELREKHQELLNYFIRDHDIKWSRLFGIMERAKRQLDIEDYSLGQASLEQVFLSFTKNQISEEGVQQIKRKCCCFGRTSGN